MIGLALRLARRELRGGFRGAGVFVACLAMGVAAVAAVGSVSQAVERAIARDARTILGGDVEVSQRMTPPGEDQVAWLESLGRLSRTVEMRAMAAAVGTAKGGRRAVLVELKAVDGAYPLFGSVALDPDMPLHDALAPRDGTYGAAADSGILHRLGLSVGDRVKVGEAVFELRARIAREPDRATSVFTLGPRLMIAAEALPATGLVREGSLVAWDQRLALPPGVSAGDVEMAAAAAFPDALWRVRGPEDAAPGLRRIVERMALYLTLVGLTALLVGGVGVANAVKAHLDSRLTSIAILKCVGAPARLVFLTYLSQVGMLAGVAILGGLALGAGAPWLAAGALASRIDAPVALGLYPGPLALAAGLGLAVAIVFSLRELARARDLPPAALFRDTVAPAAGHRRRGDIAILAAGLALLAGLTLAGAGDRMLALFFLGGTALAFLAFRLVAHGFARAAARAGREPAITRSRPGLRLALANLHRPGAPTPSIVLSLGLGLTVLVTVSLVAGNFTATIRDQIPSAAPAFFFVDIQPDQVERFEALLGSHAAVERVERVPSLRGRIVAVDGRPVREDEVPPDARWVVRGDRGVTYAAERPATARLAAGEWWPAGYRGPALASMDAGAARALGLAPGDSVTLNILGREVTARIANLREIDWSEIGINFVFILSPGVLEAAPQTHIATAYLPAGPDEDELERAVADAFPNVSAVRVRTVLETAARVLGDVNMAVAATAGVTLAVGLLVLAGAVAAGRRRRVRDAVLLKVLGATRGDVLRAYMAEFALVGSAAALIAAALGSLIAWAVLTLGMNLDWRFLAWPVAAIAAGGVAVTAAAGFLGTWRALSVKVAPALRNE